MKEHGKKLVLALIGVVVLTYVVSPLDLLPGPVDDAVVIIWGLSALIAPK